MFFDGILFIGIEMQFKDKNGLELITFYNIKEVVEMFAYEEIPFYFRDYNNDLELNIMNEEELTNYITNILNKTNQNEQLNKSLFDIKDDIMRLLKNPTIESFLPFLDKFNKNLSLMGEGLKYLFFDSYEKANDYYLNICQNSKFIETK